MSAVIEPPIETIDKHLEELDTVTIRFAGDSGDGMQLTGTQFTNTSAIMGNDISTLPDFPAEIRAPAGSLPGVSGFQLNFSNHDIRTPGDQPNVLVAMNPAALKVNLPDLEEGGTLIINTDEFTKDNLEHAAYKSNPLEDGSLVGYRVHQLPISTLNRNALKGNVQLSRKEIDRSKNFFALGVLYWLYDRPLDSTLSWINSKFKKNPELVKANEVALKTGYNFAETTEVFTTHYTVKKAVIAPGRYRKITGNEATAIGMIAAGQLAGKQIIYCSYPITPASDILHALAAQKNFNVITFQAEDEIAAIGAAIGAAYAGALGVTSSSGPGVALKTEMLGLAIATELPIVVVDAQRAGPSTGMPTKAEQSDLFQAVHGRNADAPLAVLAAATASDCFDVAIEAVRIATKYMTPVILLSDAYLAHAAEPWRLPDASKLPRFPVHFRTDPAGFHPFVRDPVTLARAWAVPGTPQLEHRIGGLERDYDSGHISYDPDNHARMTKARADKIAGIANDIPLQNVSLGEDHGKLAVVGWGSTFGAIHQAVKIARDEGNDVAHIHVRYLSPFPRNLGDLLRRYDRVLVPEMNNGQLVKLLRAEYLVDAEGFSKVTGKPFRVTDIVQRIRGGAPPPSEGSGFGGEAG